MRLLPRVLRYGTLQSSHESASTPCPSGLSTYVSTQTRNLPVLEMALPFPAMVPLPEMGNPISRTALTVRFLHFLARAHVQSRKSGVALRKTLPTEYLCMVLHHNARSEKHHFWLLAQLEKRCSIQTKIKRRTVQEMA